MAANLVIPLIVNTPAVDELKLEYRTLKEQVKSIQLWIDRVDRFNKFRLITKLNKSFEFFNRFPFHNIIDLILYIIIKIFVEINIVNLIIDIYTGMVIFNTIQIKQHLKKQIKNIEERKDEIKVDIVKQGGSLVGLDN